MMTLNAPRPRLALKMSHLKRTGRHLAQTFRALGALVLIFTLSSCGEPLPEQVDLTQGYHMFGIRVDPPVARPDDVITITAYDHHPRLKDLVYTWSICLYSHGAGSNYECVREEALISLPGEVTPRVRIDLSRSGLDLRTRLRLLQELDVTGERRSLVDGLDLMIILKSGDPSEQLVRSVKRLRVIDVQGDEPLAENPQIIGWRIEEANVANRREPCLMAAPGPLSAQRVNGEGVILGGHERIDVINEVRGLPLIVPDDPNSPECVMHSSAQLNVELDVEGPLRYEWDTQNSYMYRWYITSGHSAVEPVSLGGEGIGRYQLLQNSYRAELIFTVRDPAGGFSVGRQALNLVPGIPTR